MKSNSKKIITGDWDGQLIWRYQTSEERLEDAEIDIKLAQLYEKLQNLNKTNDIQNNK